jgi:hypothetical protein
MAKRIKHKAAAAAVAPRDPRAAQPASAGWQGWEPFGSEAAGAEPHGSNAHGADGHGTDWGMALDTASAPKVRSSAVSPIAEVGALAATEQDVTAPQAAAQSAQRAPAVVALPAFRPGAVRSVFVGGFAAAAKSRASE